MFSPASSKNPLNLCLPNGCVASRSCARILYIWGQCPLCCSFPCSLPFYKLLSDYFSQPDHGYGSATCEGRTQAKHPCCFAGGGELICKCAGPAYQRHPTVAAAMGHRDGGEYKIEIEQMERSVKPTMRKPNSVGL